MIFTSFEKNKSLKEFTTFGIGGEAKYFLTVSEIPSMQEALLFCHKNALPFLILGKGSNILMDDKGFNGLVILNRIAFLETQDESLTWHVGGGYSFSLLGHQTAKEGLEGLEFASGIPASVGGAVFMNAGANGRETSESLEAVDFVTEEGILVSLKKEELSFGYRHSSFQERKGAIVGATFRLKKNADAKQKQLEIIAYRKKTQPLKEKSAGCVFRNPPSHSAGALIDQCGLKGKKIGGAEVSTLHANFIINTQSATATEVLSLIDIIQDEVKRQTGVELKSEIRCIPYESVSC